MHICQEEIAVILASVPAVRYLVAWIIRQRAVQVWWARNGELKRTLHCASCHDEIKEEGR